VKDELGANTKRHVTTPALRHGPGGEAHSADSPQSPPVTSGPVQEFAAECEAHFDQVWRQLRAMGVAERYLDDATQEVFLIAHQKVGSFEGRARLSTWLYAIAYRVGSNYRRRARRDAESEPFEVQDEGDGQDPEQALANKQAAQIVQDFCNGLSEKLRDVFVLCLLEGQPATEVAALLDLPENTVYSRVRLVREAFRKELNRRQELMR